MTGAFFDNPKQLVADVISQEGIYILKVKCLGCRAGAFIPYSVPIIQENLLRIREHAYPIDVIEEITFRCKEEWGRQEYVYRMSSAYLKQFLNEQTRAHLMELKLL